MIWGVLAGIATLVLIGAAVYGIGKLIDGSCDDDAD